MSDAPVEADPVVRTALQLLPVPDHEPDFWNRLSGALDTAALDTGARATASRPVASRPVEPVGVDEPGRSTAEVPVVELVPTDHLGVVPPALRRRSNVVISAVAVAAAVVAVVAGAALVRQRSATEGGTTQVASAPDDRSQEPDGEDPAASSLAAPPADDTATQAVEAWVGALADGDVDASWAALGPASQAHWGTQAAFEEERSALAEGYGAWSTTSPDMVLVTPVDPDDPDLVVVTLVGTVAQEGRADERADAFPVRMVDGEPRIELYAVAGEVEWVAPEAAPHQETGATVASGDAIVVVVPAGVEGPVIRLDDGEAMICGEAEGTELTPLAGTSGQRCSYRPDGGIARGDRVLTVAFRSPDSSEITARAVLFEAA